MKKQILAATAVSVLVLASGAYAYWLGNQPAVTYYPNGEIKTSAQRELFKQTGEYKVFREDGTLSQKYKLVDGVRAGAGYIYAGAVTVEVNYNSGVLIGPMKINTNGAVPELDNLQINLANGFTVEYKQNAEGNTAEVAVPDVSVSGKLACSDDEFLDKMQAFMMQRDYATYKDFSKCLVINSATVEGDMFKCQFNGTYQYPKYKTDSQTDCVAKGFGEQILAAAFNDIGVDNIQNLKFSTKYDSKDDKFLFIISDDKEIYNQTQSFKGVEEIAEAAVEFAFSEQDTKDTVKFISTFLKYFVISDSQLNIEGKPISMVNGDFNFIDGFSNPWTVSLFGLEDTLTSQMKINDKGAVLNVAYPVSKKPFISLGLQINDNFKEKYKSFISLLTKEFSENSEDVAVQNIMNMLPEYSMAFSDVINSLNILLMNNKGEKVMGAVFNVKPGVDFISAMENLQNAVTVKIIVYKNNKPSRVIAGDMEKGFVVDGQTISLEEVPNYLDDEAIDEVVAQVESEFAAAYQQMKNNNYRKDPFIQGFYDGYNGAMQQYKSMKVSTQVYNLAQNIRAVYADATGYNGLNNAMAHSLKVLPEEMINNGKVVHALGGNVALAPAKAFAEDDEDLAFVIRLDGLNAESCVALVTMQNLDDDSGFMALGVNEDVRGVYLDAVDEQGAQCQKPNVRCAKAPEMELYSIMMACQDGNNTLMLKFH